MSYSFCNQIIPNIYLGSVESSQDETFIKENNISVIVNCSKDIKDTFSLNLLKPIEEAPADVQKWLLENSFYIKYYRVPVDDNGKEEEVNNFFGFLIKTIPQVAEDYKKGKLDLTNNQINCLILRINEKKVINI